MKESPIIFSGEMVRAILDGRKTQTRRMVKPQGAILTDEMARAFGIRPPPAENQAVIRCPYGNPGDRLWVKETFYPMTHLNAKAYFRASDPLVGVPRWKPSIFMPKALSRIKLEIESIRVERLRDISDDDCIAEGCSGEEVAGADQPLPVMCYRAIWESINGPGSWDKNPWVWVITFRRIGQ